MAPITRSQGRKATAEAHIGTEHGLNRVVDASSLDSVLAGRRKKSLKKKTPVDPVNWLDNIPAEMLLEILARCDPLSLINLSLTSKYLRHTLISPERKSIWTRARRNVPGVPELPPGFTERSFAAFLFLEVCQACGEDAPYRTAMSGLRVRICESCQKLKCMDAYAAFSVLGTWEVVCLLPGYIYLDHNRRPVYPEASVFFSRDVLRRLQERATTSDRGRLTKKEGKEMISFRKTSWELDVYFEKRQLSERRELQEATGIRLMEFVEALLKLGHAKEDIDSVNLDQIVNKTMRTTVLNCTWESGRPYFEAALENLKMQRLHKQRRRERRQLFEKLYWETPAGEQREALLPVQDFFQLPSVEKLDDLPILPANSSRRTSQLQIATSAIRQEMETFAAKMRLDLVRIWCAGHGCTDLLEGKDDAWNNTFLSLALTVFVNSRTRYHSARMPASEGVIHYSGLFRCPGVSFDPGRNYHPRLTHKWKEYSSRITYSAKHIKAMQNTLALYGMDATTTTLASLETQAGWLDTFNGFLQECGEEYLDEDVDEDEDVTDSDPFGSVADDSLDE